MLRLMLKEKVRGSISILLVIVMMPMMAVAAIIVDASGYELSKSMVSSAADLTMNTALSYYDQTLKEVYGIFGVSTTSEELQNNLKDYFVDSLIANGIVADEDEYNNSEVLKNLSNIFSGNVGQVIDIDAAADSSVTLTGLDGTQVSKPEVLKTQIVEFMKYRTPIYGTMSLFDGLSSLSKVSEQSKVTSAQVAVNEAIGDFNEACENAYKKIKDALDYYSQNKDSMQWDEEYEKESYGKIDDAVRYLYGKSLTEHSYMLKYKCTNIDDYTRIFSINKDMFIGRGFATDIENVGSGENILLKDKFTYISNTIDTLIILEDNEKQNASENMREFIDEIKTGNEWKLLGTIEQKLDDIYSYDAKLFDTETIADINTFIETINSLKNDVRKVEVYYDYLYDSGENSDSDDRNYETFMTQLYKYYEESRLLVHIVEQLKTEADTLCGEVNVDINNKISYAKEYEKRLTDAKDAIDTVLDNLADVNTKNNTFKTAINTYSSNGAEADSFSIQMSEEQAYNEQSFSEDEIKQLQTRLGEMATAAGTLKSNFENIKYCEKAIKDIESLSQAHAAYEKNTNGNYVIPEYEPDSKMGEINESEYTFWRYLQQAFANTSAAGDSKESENAQKVVTEAKSESESALSKDNGMKIGGVAEGFDINLMPSKQLEDSIEEEKSINTQSISIGGGSGKAGKYKGFSSMMNNMSSVVSNLFSKEKITSALENARDNLFVTDYAFQMFSYYTYEKEKKEEAKRTTITGEKINSDNNQLYGAEVEYIIFGSGNNGIDGEKSVDTAMNYIFAIRFLCNTTYAVTSGSVDKMTVPPAVAIQTATGGIVPYKLPELVFELALALAETFIDMQNLKNGEDVPLFKNSETWNMSAEGGVEIAQEAIKNKVEEEVKEVKDEAVSAFNDVVDKAGTTVTVQVDELTSEYKKAVSGVVNEGLETIMSKINKSIIDQIEDVIQKANSGLDGITADTIIDKAWTEVKNYLSTLGKDNIVYKIASTNTVEAMVKGYFANEKIKINEALNKLKTPTSEAYKAIRDVQKSISGDLAEKVSKFIVDLSKTDEIEKRVAEATNKYTSELKTEINNEAELMADRVIEITNDNIDAAANAMISRLGFSETSSGSGSVSASSLLTFSYTDYLRMFLFLKLSTNSNAVMCRIADVIQMNVAKRDGKPSYKLSDRYTYVQLNVNVRYNTLFLSDDWFKNISGESKSGMDVEYYGVRGY